MMFEEGGSGLTTSTPHVGTVRYAAYELVFPEVDRATFTPTVASDIFALGCVIYEVSIRPNLK
jgi:serine/threonine protein kinase